jgi:hypothetical protein
MEVAHGSGQHHDIARRKSAPENKLPHDPENFRAAQGRPARLFAVQLFFLRPWFGLGLGVAGMPGLSLGDGVGSSEMKRDLALRAGLGLNPGGVG